MGIGRPSTYASIIDTILAREYVFKKGGALVPTWVAFAVAQLLEAHLPNLVDYRFTAQMEDDLDSISRGEAGHVDYLRKFYFGNGQTGLKQQLQNKAEEIDARDVSRIRLGQPEGQDPIFVRVGRYGPFLEQGERRASLPDETPPDEVTIERALELLSHAEQAEEPLGTCPDTHKPVYLKVGRFGPYVQRGSSEDEEKPKNASLMKGMKPEDVTLAVALQLLLLPRELGPHPESGRNGGCGQRTVWPLRQMRSRNPQLVGRALADGHYARRKRWNCWPNRRRNAAVSVPRKNRSACSRPRRSPASRFSCSKGAMGRI